MLITTPGGNTADLTFCTSCQKLKIVAKVKSGNYLGIGFGTRMYNTDMVIFQGDNGGMVIDSYSRGNYAPGPDAQ